MRRVLLLTGFSVAVALLSSAASAAPPRAASGQASVQVIGPPLSGKTATTALLSTTTITQSNNSSDAVCTMSPKAKTATCTGPGSFSGTPTFETITITGAAASQVYNITVGTLPADPSSLNGNSISYLLSTASAPTGDATVTTGYTTQRTVPSTGNDTIWVGCIVTILKTSKTSTASVTNLRIPVTVSYN